MFRKVLIANRGEIALRVIRACQRARRAQSVAVYSDADAHAPHVREADEAVHIGPAPSAESYLRGDRIIEAAQRVGAEAIHPGYGFLSEREWFARARSGRGARVRRAAAGGDRRDGEQDRCAPARDRGRRAGGAGNDEAAARRRRGGARSPSEFGYPGAAQGGGGRRREGDARRARREPSSRPSLDAARREAKNAFGDDAVYVEKYIDGPRHVEIQILGDAHGTMLSLGERECSVQRRHQKMIEEAPSVAVYAGRCAVAMGDTAVAAARAAGYVNAGTCEFLLDRDGQFYFLEMNTRLQVEHPVTELVTGIDLVQWQLRIAAGRAAAVPAGRDHAARMGDRVPHHERRPGQRVSPVDRAHRATCTCRRGPGVRWDGGIETGSEVGLHYDPMLAKLIVWAPTREQAIARMHRALLELTIVGVETSRDFHLRVMEDDEFRRGDIDIQWLERRLPVARRTRRRLIDGVRVARDRGGAARRSRARRPRRRARRTAAASRERRRARRRARRLERWQQRRQTRRRSATDGDRRACASNRSPPAATASGAATAWRSSCRARRRAMWWTSSSSAHGRFARGSCVRLAHGVADRVEPPCVHYDAGPLRRLPAAALCVRRAARAKSAIVRDALQRIGKSDGCRAQCQPSRRRGATA